MSTAADNKPLHPAAEWALETEFGPVEVDCTTTVVLKILDGKCKMLPGEKAAVIEIYDVVRQLPAELFDDQVHEVIDRARATPDEQILAAIHQWRVRAEELIPKPVMKTYKAKLRDGLFG